MATRPPLSELALFCQNDDVAPLSELALFCQNRHAPEILRTPANNPDFPLVIPDGA